MPSPPTYPRLSPTRRPHLAARAYSIHAGYKKPEPSVVLDSVLDVLGPGHRHRAVHHQADHVDTARLLLPVRLGAIELEEHAQLSAFALVDRLLGSAEPGAATRLHLDEHQRV